MSGMQKSGPLSIPKESAAPISPRPCTPEVGANIPTKNYDFG